LELHREFDRNVAGDGPVGLRGADYGYRDWEREREKVAEKGGGEIVNLGSMIGAQLYFL